jgi:hypothetical protein
VDPRTSGGTRHLQDVAFLLSTVPDPQHVASTMTSDDLALLGAVHLQLEDPATTGWGSLGPAQREDALLACRLILSASR